MLAGDSAAEARAEAAERKLASAAQREGELRAALDKARARGFAAESARAGLSAEQIADDNTEVQRLRAELASERAQSQAELSRLRGRLGWYGDNQRLIDQNDEELTTLRARVAELEATATGPGKRGRGNGRSAADISKIAKLEREAAEPCTPES